MAVQCCRILVVAACSRCTVANMIQEIQQLHAISAWVHVLEGAYAVVRSFRTYTV